MIRKSIDLTQPGGFPLTQDTLDYLQQAYTEVLLGLAAATLANGLTGPVIISGIRATVGPTYQTGWIYYNGDLLYFQGPIDMSGAALLLPPNVYGMGISETDTMLTFNDGSTPSVLKLRQMTIGVSTDALTSTFIPLEVIDATPSLQEGLKETEWSHIGGIAGAGITSGDAYYRKNYLNNTLELRGTFNIHAASVSDPPVYVHLAYLPAGYYPLSQTVPFRVFFRYHDSTITNAAGNDFFTGINGELATDGSLDIAPIQTSADYTVTFSTIIPLD